MREQNEYQWGEIVTNDCYHLKTLGFTPDIIYDIGANIGMFTRHALTLWPYSRVVSVEPHPETFQILKRNVAGYPNVTCIEAAIGKSPIRFGGQKLDSGHHWYGACVEDFDVGS